MKNLKKLLGVLVLAAAFVILPKDVYAKDVNVAVRTGSFMSPTTG